MEAPRPLSIDPSVLARFPGYTAVVLYARGLDPGGSAGQSDALLAAAEDGARAALSGSPLQDHPHLRAWREAYRSFGSKPSKYLCSVEALLRRVLKGEPLPRLNPLVDLYNALSIRHVLPAGGEDLDRIRGALCLTFADGSEAFDAGDAVDPPYAGEVVWKDGEGVTCRRWNWRQCTRTRLTEGTRSAYFVLDRLVPHPIGALQAAASELVDALSLHSPHCELTTEWIGRPD